MKTKNTDLGWILVVGYLGTLGVGRDLDIVSEDEGFENRALGVWRASEPVARGSTTSLTTDH